MFREMRRKGQALPDEACKEILEKAPHGVLAVSGDGGWPYAVPLSFVYSAGTVYFHCACEGHKLDAVRRDARASFCVVDSDEVVAEDRDQVVPLEYTTYFRSVIAFGRVRELAGAEEKTAALRLLAGKYAPESTEERFMQSIDRSLARTAVLALEIEQLSGKEGLELSKRRREGE